jgi:hypothetical protein
MASTHPRRSCTEACSLSAYLPPVEEIAYTFHEVSMHPCLNACMPHRERGGTSTRIHNDAYVQRRTRINYACATPDECTEHQHFTPPSSTVQIPRHFHASLCMTATLQSCGHHSTPAKEAAAHPYASRRESPAQPHDTARTGHTLACYTPMLRLWILPSGSVQASNHAAPATITPPTYNA